MEATFQPTAAAEGFIDPKALMAIRNLEMRARIVVQGFWSGIHRSPYHGFSVEFTEYRQYSQGDDPRYLDWRLYARSDRFYIKKFEDETNVRGYLVVDQSRSMDYGSLSYNKSAYANTLAATLALFLHNQGDAIGLLTFDEKIREFLPARHRPGHLRQCTLLLDKPGAGKATRMGEALQKLVTLVNKRGMVVMVSDFLTPWEELAGPLGQLAAWGHEVVLFQVLDPAELEFNFSDAELFKDMESEGELYIDPLVARKQYLRRLTAHQQKLESESQKLGIGLVRANTTEPLEKLLFQFLHVRGLQRTRRVAFG